MTELQEIQTRIAAAINKNDLAAAIAVIQPQGMLSSQERLRIYQNNFEVGLIHSLKDTYEVCHALVGDEFFTAMARTYVQLTPSRSPNINMYGENFAEFIADFSPANSLPYLSDVARLEWAWLKAFNGFNNHSLSVSHFEKLLELDIEKIIFSPPKNATLLSSNFPIHRIWNMHHHGDENTISLTEGGIKLLIWRQETQMRMDTINSSQWLFLTCLQEDLSLPAIYQKMQSHMDETAFLNFLQNAVIQGWLGGYFLHE